MLNLIHYYIYILHSIYMFAEILNKVCVNTLKTIVGTVTILMEKMQIRLWKSTPNIKFMEV